MKLVGANPEANATVLEELPGKSNYFLGSDPAKWQTNVPNYAKVRYQDVYPGVDLVYYGNQGRMEYDFMVSPGADPGQISLAFEGTENLTVNPEGDLALHVEDGENQEVHLRKPVVYQEADGARQEIPGRYSVKDNNQVRFELASYDPSKPLVIDPILVYSTYLGGDALVVKLNSAGSAILYSSTFGGAQFEHGYAIEVDSFGNVYVSGPTDSDNFPTTPGAFQTARRGSTDLFVVKLDSTGSSLLYSTYLGGSSSEWPDAIALDGFGNVYLTGATQSHTFPTTPSSFDRFYGSEGDAFVTKLNPTLSALIYSAFLGGGFNEEGNDIAVDTAGNAYVTGQTRSDNVPTTPGVYQPQPRSRYWTNGFTHAFVTKVNSSGTALVYSTYLGGTWTGGYGIAVDSFGNAYITGGNSNGGADAPTFPTTPGAYQSVSSDGGNDAFVAKFNSDGSALMYSTFLGGVGSEGGGKIAVDSTGNAYVTGATTSPSFPLMNPLQSSYGGGDADAFIAKLSADGSALLFSSFLGGSAGEYGYSLALDALRISLLEVAQGPRISLRLIPYNQTLVVALMPSL
jgi:hypothetical protein